jgi:hypothetical protein
VKLLFKENTKMKNILILLLINLQLLIAEDLSVDNQFTDKQKLEFSFGLDYINSYSNSLGSGDTILETANGDFVKVPVNYENSNSSDYIGVNLSLNYGFSDKLSIFSYASGHYLYSRDINNPDSKTQFDKQFDNFSMGISYIIKKETKTPAYFTRLSTTLVDRVDFNSTIKNKNFTTANLTLGSYFSTDPITFMFQTTYIYSKKLEYNNTKLKDGDVYIFSPSIYFNINPYVTMNFDLQFQHMAKDKENVKYITKNRNELKKGIGVIYELNKNKTISVDYSYTNTTSSQDTVSIVYTYKL